MNTTTKFGAAHEMFESVVSGRDETNRSYAYRGHGDAEYDLIPSFLRDDSNLKFLELEGDGTALTISSAPFRTFYQTANQMGHALPSVSQAKHQNYTSTSEISALNDFTEEVEREYSPDDFEIMAFAQHYGLPTPLLDWSRSPLVAMYFAASDALNLIAKSLSDQDKVEFAFDGEKKKTILANVAQKVEGHFASVWRADTNAISEMVRNRGVFDQSPDEQYLIQFFTPRTQGNSNIVAQQGLFSIHYPLPMSFDYRHALGEKRCLKTVVDSYIKWHEGRPSNSKYVQEVLAEGPLHEFLLPLSEIPALMSILEHCGVHAASIFPGHKGCAERVRERALLALIKRLLSA